LILRRKAETPIPPLAALPPVFWSSFRKSNVNACGVPAKQVLSPASLTDLNLQPTAKIRYHDIKSPRELPMAQFIVRNLEDDVKARLKRRAAQHRRSMEEEVRHILRDAVKEQNRHIAKLGSRIAARFAKAGLSTDLPELHGQIPRSAEFAK
jgi:plasmid stability protein